jgi:hypothetical protein
MFIYLLNILFILVFCVWWWARVRDVKEYNKKLFIRAWNLQLFLMEIYPECPPHTQALIEKHLKDEVQSL